MSGFWRFALLAFFGAVGIALALCLGLSSKAPFVSPAADSAANVSAAPATAAKSRHTGAIRSAGPVVEQMQPPIAQLSPATNLQHTPAPVPPPLVNPQASTATVTPAEMQLAQDDMMQQLRKELEKAVQRQNDSSGSGPPAPGDNGQNANSNRNTGAGPPAAGPGGAGTAKKLEPKSKPRIARMPGEGDNNLSIHIQDSDLRDVLELLSEQGGLNILPSPSVQGAVSASLSGVDIDTALNAILRSTGFVAHRDGKFIYVGTPADFKAMEQSLDKVATRVYRLNYTRASDIQALVTPLLTAGIGSISVTAPAEEGIGSDGNKDGGNKFAGGDSILVRDYIAVLDQIDQVIAEIDHKPAQVAIEAMILRVTLDDKYSFGVDFELLRKNLRFSTGSPLSTLKDFNVTAGGLKFAYLDGSTGAFVSALETIGDTDVIASPKVMVIDKARAEIQIGQQLGYVNTTITETSTAQNVQFLEVGAQLRLRPFISSDGLVRMEVHPELSTGQVKVEQGLTLPDKDVTQVTTNIMIPDGCTVVIGGLLREDLGTTAQQVPFFGSLPGIGFLFRNKTETTKKEEIIVLITPHIVCEPDACCEGDKAAAEFHRRQAVYADQMSPLGKRYLGRKYYRLAQAAWGHGDQETALRMIDLAVHFDPESRAAIDLRTDIWNGRLVDDHTLMKPGMVGPPPGIGPFDNSMPTFGPMPWEGQPPGPGAPFGIMQGPQSGPQIGPQQREALPPGVEAGPHQSMEQRQNTPTTPTTPIEMPRKNPNLNAPSPAARSSTASLKLAPLGSGAPLMTSVPKAQPLQPQPAPTKSVVKTDQNVRKASATQVLDGDHMPIWMVDGLLQGSGATSGNAATAGSAASQSQNTPPAQLSPTNARPLTPEAR